MYSYFLARSSFALLCVFAKTTENRVRLPPFAKLIKLLPSSSSVVLLCLRVMISRSNENGSDRS